MYNKSIKALKRIKGIKGKVYAGSTTRQCALPS